MQPLPQLVRQIQGDLGTMLPLDIAEKHGVPMRMVQDVKADRYVRVTRGKNGRFEEVQLYDAKGYVPSGKSVLGAIEISGDGLLLKCHECGEWHDNLATHIKEHGIKAREYKQKHGLKMGTCLLNEPLRVKRVNIAMKAWAGRSVAQRKKQVALMQKMNKAKVGKNHSGANKNNPTTMNLQGRCAVQTLHDYRALGQRLGYAPTWDECNANSVSVVMLKFHHGGLRAAAKLCGFKQRPSKSVPVGSENNGYQKARVKREQKIGVGLVGGYGGGSRKWYSDSELIGLVRAFVQKHGRLPVRSDERRKLLPTRAVFRKRFGSWERAVEMAGCQSKLLSPSQHVQLQWANMSSAQRKKQAAGFNPKNREKGLRNWEDLSAAAD